MYVGHRSSTLVPAIVLFSSLRGRNPGWGLCSQDEVAVIWQGTAAFTDAVVAPVLWQ